MRPDNTPLDRAAPIGRVKWFGGVTSPALLAADSEELAISLTNVDNFAVRLMCIDWDITLTDANAPGDLNDISDGALMTVPTTEQIQEYLLQKAGASVQYTITNTFSVAQFVPGQGGTNTGNASLKYSFQEPFVMLSPMIFRIINASANAAPAMPYTSHVWGYLYTIEQYNQGSIWRTSAISQ